MKASDVKACVLCEKSHPDCNCKFKAPAKGKWTRRCEIWSTIPRTMKDIIGEIEKTFPISIKRNDPKFIFKVSFVELTKRERGEGGAK